MKTRIFEATDGVAYGKFLVGIFDDEWKYRPKMEDADNGGWGLIANEGWRGNCFLLLDLSNPGVGAIFVHNRGRNMAKADVEKRKISICWIYTEFLQWFYQQDLEDLDRLPAVVDFRLPADALENTKYDRPSLHCPSRADRGIGRMSAIMELHQDSAHPEGVKAGLSFGWYDFSCDLCGFDGRAELHRRYPNMESEQDAPCPYAGKEGG